MIFRVQGVLQTEQNTLQNKFNKIHTFIEKYNSNQKKDVKIFIL